MRVHPGKLKEVWKGVDGLEVRMKEMVAFSRARLLRVRKNQLKFVAFAIQRPTR
jgi:hypothetical protein